MTNRDILNALGDIDESYITEANGRIKSTPLHSNVTQLASQRNRTQPAELHSKDSAGWVVCGFRKNGMAKKADGEIRLNDYSKEEFMLLCK